MRATLISLAYNIISLQILSVGYRITHEILFSGVSNGNIRRDC